MKTATWRSGRARSSASRPSLARSTASPRWRSIASITTLVDGVVLGDEHAAARPGPRAAGRRAAGGSAGAPHVARSDLRDGLEQLRPGAPAWSGDRADVGAAAAASPAEVSITSRWPCSSGAGAHRGRDLDAAHPGHLGVEHDELVRLARARRRSSIAERRRAALGLVADGDPAAQVRRRRSSRLVALSSTTSTRRFSGEQPPARAGWRGARRRPRSSGDREAERAALAAARTSAVSSPPIISTSRREIASPRPVPPKRRVVDVSACAKGSNSRASCVRVDADAGVADLDAQQRAGLVGAARRSRAPTTSPCSVNLTALASRLVSTWRRRPPSPRSVPGQRVRRSRRSARRPWRAPAARASRRSSSTISRRSKSCSSSSSLPASIFEKSRMSLMTPSSASPEELGGLRRSERCSSLSGVSREQLDHPDHAVERRADLVAHVGQELRLEPRGLDAPRRARGGARRRRWPPSRWRRSPRAPSRSGNLTTQRGRLARRRARTRPRRRCAAPRRRSAQRAARRPRARTARRRCCRHVARRRPTPRHARLTSR